MKTKSLSPLNDVIFSNVFGEQRNIDITGEFLKTVLDIPEAEYGKLIVKNSVLKPQHAKGKTGVVDILLNTKSGKFVHIEMQVKTFPQIQNRILAYDARIIDRQLRRGDKFEKLHQVISIVICDHVFLTEEEHYLNVYEMRNVRSNRRFTDLLKVIILELPKVPATGGDDPLRPWLEFFKCETREDYTMLVKRHPKLKKASDCAQRVSLLEKLDWYFFDLEMHRRDVRTLKAYAREQVFTEGKAEKSLEIARKLKIRGQPLAEIAEDTGLSLAAIEQL